VKPNLQKRPPNDPAAGGFGVLAATLRLGREFIGCCRRGKPTAARGAAMHGALTGPTGPIGPANIGAIGLTGPTGPAGIDVVGLTRLTGPTGPARRAGMGTLGTTGPTGPNVASPLNENLIASRHGSRENGSNAEPRSNGEKGPGQQRQLEEEGAYPYRDASGQVAFEVMRFVLKQGENYVVGKYGKRIRTSLQRRPSGEPDQSWLWGLGAGEFMRRAPGKDWGKFDATEFEQYPATRQRKIFTAAPVIPYQLPDLLKAVAAGHTICIVEDEEKVELIRGFGFPATCCAGGAKKWRPEHSVYLKGADVVLLRDNDPVEREHMELIAKSLAPIARLRILELPNLPEKGDVVDWHEAGGSAEEFARLLAAAPDYMPNATVNISAVREFIHTITAQAKAALNGAQTPGLLQLSRLHPGNDKLVPSRFYIDDVERMVCTAIADSERGHNVYIEGRLVRPGLNGNERGKLADTVAVFAYVIDSDADKGWAGPRPSL
jgi:hypothetical protein